MPTNEERIQQVKRKALENDSHSGCSQSVQPQGFTPKLVLYSPIKKSDSLLLMLGEYPYFTMRDAL